MVLRALLLSSLALMGCPGDPPAPSAPTLRWVQGDVHMHSESANTNNALSFGTEELHQELREQGLEVGGLLAWGLRPQTTRKRVPAATAMLLLGTEVSDFGHGFPDHLLMFGEQDLLDFPRRLYTLPIARWARKRGALVGVAHANHWAGTPGSYPRRWTQSPFELPACLALGEELFLCTEIVDSAGFRRLWYGLLNCGFRVPLAGGSDWPVAGNHAGDTRTYVAVEGELTPRTWLEGVRRGRTVVATGRTDFLLVKVGDALPGDVVQRAAPGKVELELLTSLAAPGVVDVVHNGEVAIRFRAPAGVRPSKVTIDLPDSGWVALRSKNVHTGAITLEVAGRPVRASVRDARYFRNYVDVLLKQIDAPQFVPLAFEQEERVARERKAARADYAPAKDVFVKILAEAEARAKELPARDPGKSQAVSGRRTRASGPGRGGRE